MHTPVFPSLSSLFSSLFSLALAGTLCGCAGTAQRPVQPRIDPLGMPVLDESAALSPDRNIGIAATTRRVNVH